MNRDALRRFLFGSPLRIFAFYSVTWGLFMFLLSGNYRSGSLFIYAVTASLFGLVMTRITIKRKDYGLTHLEDGTFNKMKTYNQLFAEEALPKDVSVYSDYREYVESRKRQGASSKAGLILTFVLFGGFALASFLYLRDLILGTFFCIVLIALVIMEKRRRQRVKTADSILLKLDQS